MRSWLNLTLFGSLIWAAAGCCCYDPCCYYGGYNYPVTSYNYGGGYNTVATGGYNAAATNTYSTTTAQTSAASTYVAGNQSKFSNTNTGLTNYAPTNQFAANNNNYTATGNYQNGNVVGYQPPQTTVTPQFQGNMAMSGGSPCPPCPCESTDMTSGGLFMQDANGQMIPMEGMVYDASVMPSPMMTVPGNEATEQSPNSTEAKPGQLVPVPQPEIGIPTSTDGRPLVPPAE